MPTVKTQDRCAAGPTTDQTLLTKRVKETSVGVEPTSSCFAGNRLAVGHRRRSKAEIGRRKGEIRKSLIELGEVAFRLPPSAHSLGKHPRRELNPVFDLRRVACESGTLRGHISPIKQRPAEESNLVRQFRRLLCKSGTLAGRKQLPVASCQLPATKNEFFLNWQPATDHRHRLPVTIQYQRRTLEHGRDHDLLLLVTKKGCPNGVEPILPGSQPGVQNPLHHEHRADAEVVSGQLPVRENRPPLLTGN